MKNNDWRGQLQEIIEEETDMERPMIPRYAKGYAKLVLEDFISSEIEKAEERGYGRGLEENLDKRNSEGGLTILESLMLSKLNKEEK